jgi:hypothetical protein
VKWVTREQVRIDRVASAWLIRRFVDPEAEFLFVPGPRVLQQAQALGAIAFHVPGAELGQTSERTGFDAIVAKYSIDDPAIPMMAEIVRSADKRGDAPEGPGIRAMSHGFAAMGLPDDQVLQLEMPAFEALYHYCRTRRPGAGRGDRAT